MHRIGRINGIKKLYNKANLTALKYQGFYTSQPIGNCRNENPSHVIYVYIYQEINTNLICIRILSSILYHYNREKYRQKFELRNTPDSHMRIPSYQHDVSIN